MSFQNQISARQPGVRTAGLQDQKTFSNKRNNSSRKISHERSGSLVEKDLTKRPGHVKRPSLPKQSFQKEETSSRKPVQIGSTHHQSLATELQEDLIDFVTSTIPTYLTEIRSFASNTLEKFLFLQEGDLDIHDTIQNFRARKAKIEDQTQQMERGVLKLNFAFNSQKKQVEVLKAAQHNDDLFVKRFHSGQEGRTLRKQEDIQDQKLEDIVSYLSQKNNFLLNRLQLSPVKPARMDFSPTKDEHITFNNVKGQQSSKDLFQQIDCLSLVSEIKNLKLQTKDLATDFKNLQEKYREVKKENEYLMRDNIKVRQDLDSTKSLYEIEKQMHQEVKRLLRIKTKTLEIRNTLRRNESPGLSLDSPSIRQNQTILGLSPLRVQEGSAKNSKRTESLIEKKEVADQDFGHIFKKFEEDNAMLDQLRGELTVLQERLAKEKEFQKVIQVENKSLQQQTNENALLQKTQINYLIKNVVDAANKSLKNLLVCQEPLTALAEPATEIANFFEGIKNFLQSMDQNNNCQSLDILQENVGLILKKICENHQMLSNRLLEMEKSSQESLNRYRQAEEQNFAVSELLKVVGMLKEDYKDFITAGFRIDDETKVAQDLREQLQSLIHNIFTQYKKKLNEDKEAEMINLNNQLALLGKKVEENSQDLTGNHEKLTSYFALLEEKDQKYAELLQKFNSKEGELASKLKEIENLYQQREMDVDDLKISLEEKSKEFQKETEIALSSQINKVIKRLTENLGLSKNEPGDQENEQDLLEQRIDEICNQINESQKQSEEKLKHNFESVLSLLKNQSEEENAKLVAIKNKLEHEVQLYLKNEALYKQEIETLSSTHQEIQGESLSHLSKLKEQESDLQILQELHETLQKDFDSANKTIKIQNDQIEEIHKKAQGLQSNLEKIAEEKELISKELEKSEFEKEILARKIQDQSKVYEMTQMQLSESQKAISEQFNHKLLEIEALQQENFDVKKKCDQAKEFTENMKNTHQAEVNEKSHIIDQLSQLKENLLGEIESIKNQTINLEAMKTQLEQDLENRNQEIVKLTIQLSSFTEEMKAKEDEISNLLSDRKNIASMLQTLEAENTKIKENLESFEKELNRYSSERSVLKAEITQLQQEKQKLEIENEQLNLLKDNLVEKTKSLEDKTETLVYSSLESENQIKILKEDLTTKEIEQKKLQEDLQEEANKRALSETQYERQQQAHEEILSNLTKEIEQLLEKIKSLENALLDSEEQTKLLKDEHQTKEFQIVSLTTQLTQQENERNASEISYGEQQKSHEEVQSNLTKEIEQLRLSKDELNEKIQSSESTLFDSKNQIKSLEENLANAERQFKEQIESIKIQLQEEQNQRVLSAAKSDEQQQTHQEAFSTLTKEFATLTEQKQAIEKEFNHLKLLNEGLNEKGKSLESQINILRTNELEYIQEFTKVEKQFKGQIESLKAQVHQQESQRISSEKLSEEQQKSNEETLSNLSKEVMTLTEQNIEINKKLLLKEKEFEQIEALRGDLAQKVELFENSLLDSEEKIKSLKEEISTKETQYSQELASHKQQIKSLEMQLKEEERRRNISEMSNDELQKYHEDALSNLSKEVMALTEQKVEIDKKLSVKEKEAEQLGALRDDLAKKIESLEKNLLDSEDQIKSLREELSTKETLYSQELATNNQQIESLEIRLKEEENKRNTSNEEIRFNLTQEINLLNEQKIEIEKEFERLGALRHDLAEKIKSLENTLLDSEEQIKSLKEELSIKETQYSQELATHKQQIESLEMQLKQEKERQNTSEISNEEIRSNFTKEIALLNEQKIVVENKLSIQEKEFEQLESLRDDLVEKIKSLESTLLDSDNQIKSLSTKEIQYSQELATHKQEIESLEMRLKEEENKRNIYQTSNEEVQSNLIRDIALLNEQKIEIENKLSIQEKETEQLGVLSDDLNERIKLLENTLLDLENQIKSLKEEIVTKEIQYTEEIANNKRQIESLEMQLKEEERKRNASEISNEEVLSNLKKEIAILNEQKIVVENKLSSQEKENNELGSLRDDLAERIKSLENTLLDSDNQIKALREELATKETQYSQELATHKQQVELLEVQLKEEESKRNTSEISNEEVQSNLTQKILENEGKLSIQEKEIEELRLLKDDLVEKIKSLESTLVDSENQVKSLEGNLAVKIQEVANAEQKFKEQSEFSKIQLEEEKNQRVSLIEDQKITHSQILKELTSAKEDISDFEKEVEQLTLLRNDLIEKIKSLESTLLDSENQIKSLGEDLAGKTQEITHAEQMFKEEIESLKTQLEEEKNQRALYEELQEMFSRVSNELATLTEQRSNFEKEAEQWRSSRDELIEKIKSLESTLVDSENQIKSLKEEFATKESQYTEEIANLKEQIEPLETQLEEEENKRVSSEALYEEHQTALQEALSSVSKELATLTEQKQHVEKELSENLASINSLKDKLDESNKRLKSELNERLDALRKLEEKQKEIDQLKEASTPLTNPQVQDIELTKKLLSFLETLTQHTLHHTKAIYQGIESTTVRDVEFAFYGAFKEIIESNNAAISKLSEIKSLQLDLFKGHEALVSELVDQLNQSMEQNQKAKSLCENLERISCAASPISLQLHRMRSYQEENQSPAFDPRNLDMSGSISKYESSFMDLAAHHAGADLEDSLSQKDEALKSLESKIDNLNVSHQKIAQENNLLKRNVENTSKVQGQLRVANEKFAVEYDKLVDELKDRETDEERFALQIKILKKELEETRTRLAQSEGANEREHLKKILLKFLEVILRGKQAKETPEMLKIICSLLFCSEAEKNKLLELLNRTLPKKASSLLKVFS